MAQSWWLYIAIAANVISGVGIAVLMKGLYLQQSLDEYFTHPQFLVASMFVGETLSIFPWLWLRQKEEPLSKDGRKQAFAFTWIALFQFFGPTMSFIGVNLATASIFQMIKGLNILWISILSRLMIKNKKPINKQQTVGWAFILCGVIMAGIANIFFVETDIRAKWPGLGCFLILWGQLCISFKQVCEEINLTNIHPLLAVSIDGFTGLFLSLIALTIGYFIQCDDPTFCFDGRYENAIFALQQLANSGSLLAIWLGFVLCMAMINSSGVSITKQSRAITRTAIMSLRMVVSWVISLMLGWEDWIWLEFFGLVFLILPGISLYSELFKLEFLYPKSSLEKRLIK